MSSFSPNIAILSIVLLIVAATVAILNLPPQAPVSASPYPTSAAPGSEKPSVVPSATTLTTSPAPTPTTVPTPPAFLNYIYPHAEVTFQTSSKLELESSNDPDAITDWYKNKIRGLGFSAKSFAQTNTNGEVFNKLSAARTGEKIEITIKKDQNASKVTITVDSP